MTRIEIATLACKILAVWVLAQAMVFASGLVFMGLILARSALRGERLPWEELVAEAVTGGPALGMILVGLFLWFRASHIAARMVSDDPTPVTRANVTQKDVLSIACTVIGVLTLFQLLRDVAATIIDILHGDYTFREWRSTGHFWSAVIMLTVSIWLILGARGLVRVIVLARDKVRREDDFESEKGDEAGPGDSSTNPPG